VPNAAESQPPMNLLEFWSQWYEMTTSMWANAMQNDKTARMDSSSFDSFWIKTANTVLEHVKNNAQALLNPQEAWKLWFDTTMNIWRSAVNMGGDPLGMIAAWIKVMENVQEEVRSGASLSVDPLTLFCDWCNAMNKPWSRMVENIIPSERFFAFTGPFLESYSHLISAFRHASEAYVRALHMPTLSDITHVAELVVNLEEKVDTIGDTIERVKVQATPNAAIMAKIMDLEQRLNQIEIKLDALILQKSANHD
jgi:hypothetical protein